jgi:hypothetical protein
LGRFFFYKSLALIFIWNQNLSALDIDNRIISSLFPDHVTKDMNYITVDGRGKSGGQLGNQCFRVSAGIGFALDNGYFFSLPPAVKNLYPEIFHKFPLMQSKKKGNKTINCDVCYKGQQRFRSSMCILGFPFNARYFSDHSDVIRFLFEPKSDTIARIREKNIQLLESPGKYVGLHIRTFGSKFDAPFILKNKQALPLWGISPLYYEKAINYFDEGVTFVVFSDNIVAAKEMLSIFDRKFIFSDGTVEDDFYLISMMDNMIVENSSFAMFAAYLNKSPTKVVVAPQKSDFFDVDSLEWVRMDNDDNRVNIGKEYDDWYEICIKHARINSL